MYHIFPYYIALNVIYCTVSYPTVSYLISSYLIVSYHNILYHTLLYCIVWCNIAMYLTECCFLNLTVSYSVVLHLIVSYRIVLYRILSLFHTFHTLANFWGNLVTFCLRFHLWQHPAPPSFCARWYFLSALVNLPSWDSALTRLFFKLLITAMRADSWGRKEPAVVKAGESHLRHPHWTSFSGSSWADRMSPASESRSGAAGNICSVLSERKKNTRI